MRIVTACLMGIAIYLLNVAELKPKACRLDRNYVYIDTCSTFNQNIKPDTVTNMHTVSHGLKSHSNGDVSHTNQKAN